MINNCINYLYIYYFYKIQIVKQQKNKNTLYIIYFPSVFFSFFFLSVVFPFFFVFLENNADKAACSFSASFFSSLTLLTVVLDLYSSSSSYQNKKLLQNIQIPLIQQGGINVVLMFIE